MGEKPKILVVDDEPRMAESLRVLLDGSGFKTFTCHSGEAAINLLSKESFDLVLLDIVMPKTDGYSVLEKISAMNGNPTVIVITGQISVNSAVAALRKGAYDYITKPVAHDELLNRVENALAQQRLQEERKTLRHRLQTSEEKYRLLVQASPDIIYTLDRSGRFAFVNDSVARLLGFVQESLIGMHYSKVIWKDDLEKANHVFDERRTGKRAFKGSILRLKRKENDDLSNGLNNNLIVELKATGIYDVPADSGSLLYKGTYGVARDVGYRMRTEIALRESEERYRALFRNNPVETIVVDRSGRISDFNLATSRNRDRLPKSGDMMYRDYAGKHGIDMHRELMDAIHHGQFKEFPEMKYDSKYLHIRMSPFSAGAIITAIDITERKTAETNLKNTIKRMESAYEQASIYAEELTEEIAQRKRIEEALRESTEKYRTLIEASPDPIVVYDMDGKVMYLNPSFTAVFGWTMDELSGHRIRFVPDECWPETRKMIRRLSAGQAISGFETRRLTKMGEIVDVDISAAAFRDENGIPIGSIIDLRDITTQKKLEVQLQQAQKMEALGTLAGGIAHDFNNLLMAIKGTASLMRYDTDSSHPLHNGLKDIEKQVDSGAKLTAQLLGYARKGKYDVRPLDINRLIVDTCEAFRRTKKEIRVHLQLAEELFAIEADRGQMEQVLFNLMINAADAMPSGGDLTVCTKNVHVHQKHHWIQDLQAGDYVVLELSDTGVGISPEIQDRIFDPFFTTKGLGRGTGLGLASVYGIIRNHGGRIEVDSKKGQGTSFIIYLPASEQKVPVPVEEIEQLTQGTETILLVDDELIVAQVGSQILKRLGYTVLTANSGEDALVVYEGHSNLIDLVILDMIMPDMGGGEVFDRIRKMNPNAKVLLSSGYSIDGQAKEIMSRGCDGFIQKPFGMKELSEKIRNILRENEL